MCQSSCNLIFMVVETQTQSSFCHASSDHCWAREEKMISKISEVVINGKWLMLVYALMT